MWSTTALLLLPGPLWPMWWYLLESEVWVKYIKNDLYLIRILDTICIMLEFLISPVYIDLSVVGWFGRIHRLHLSRGENLPPNECPDYGAKQSDGQVPVMLELWGNTEYPFIVIAPRFTLTGVVAPDRVLSIDQIVLNRQTELFEIELFWLLNCVLMLHWIVWNEIAFVC